MLLTLVTSSLVLATVFLIGVKLYYKSTIGMCRCKSRMTGKTVIVTGSNTGIGKETALDLAKRGARVILACRNIEKAKITCDEIISSTGNENVVVRYLDLSSLDSVRNFANNIIANEPQLDVLINNAGIAMTRYEKTEDGFECGMQSNHFGPFLLTNLLIDLLIKSAPSRIIMVSSFLHKCAMFNLDNLKSEKFYEPLQVYSCSKLANILMANELARRLHGTGVTANSLHPGIVLTDVWRHWPPVIRELMQIYLRICYKNVYEGAQTTIHAAVSQDLQNVSGKYFVDCKEAETSTAAMDKELAKKLWETSELLVGLSSKRKIL